MPGPGGRDVRKREAQREKREMAEKALRERWDNAEPLVDAETIQTYRDAGEKGEAIFPILPGDLFRGYESNSNPQGRKRQWTAERRAAAVNEIALRIASGEALKAILGPNRDRERLPGLETFYTWIFGIGDEYVYRVYELAQKMKVQGYVDELIEISDSARDSEEMAAVKGAELAIHTRQWIASKIMPYMYGRSETGGSGITVNISTNLDGNEKAIDGDAYRVTVQGGEDEGVE